MAESHEAMNEMNFRTLISECESFSTTDLLYQCCPIYAFRNISLFREALFLGDPLPPFLATGHQTYLCALQAVSRQAHILICFTVFSFKVGLRPNHLLHATHLVGILAAADLMCHLCVKKKSHTYPVTAA